MSPFLDQRRFADSQGSSRWDSLFQWLYANPWRLFITLWCLVFLTEFIIMLFLASVHLDSGTMATALIDSGSLGIALAAFLWFLVIKPLNSESTRLKELTSKIYNKTTDGILLLNEAGQIQSMNRSSRTILDLDVPFHSGLPMKTLFPGISECKDHDSSLATDGIHICEQAIKTPSGNHFIELTFHPLGSGKHKRMTAVFLRDLTKSRLDQQNKEAKRDMEIANQRLMILGEMAGTIAHELNTPLAALQLQIEIFRDELRSNTPDISQLSEMIEQISKIQLHITRIIKGTRSLIRGGSAHLVSPSNLQQLLENVLTLHKDLWIKDKTKMDCTLSIEKPDEPLRVSCDEVQISQVIINLLNNAYDAILPLAERSIQIRLSRNGPWAELSITDSGEIPDSIRQRLFVSLFTTKPPDKGTGLGLTLSKKIIQAHGGEIFLDDTSKNTRFIIRLPLRIGDIEDSPSPTAEAIRWITAHNQWMERFEKILAGESQEKIDPEEIRQHSKCELGQWIQSERVRMENDKEFFALDLTHKKFHEIASKIAELVKTGNRDTAVMLLSEAGEFRVLTLSILQHIRRLFS